MNIITPKVKDKVLQAILAEDKIPCTINYFKVFPDKDITELQMNLVLKLFVSIGLLEKSMKLGGYSFWIRINANIYDFFQRGGFEAQEEILKANLQKLSYELDVLSKEAVPGLKDKIAGISAIAGSIATALSLFK